jgi:AcrR family transcriptional regulator
VVQAPGRAAPAPNAPGPHALSRRDRVRAATTQEIKQTARRILIEQGPDAVSLRAIAREMGMTAPALYRYFGSHEELIKHVCCDIFLEITDDLQAAIDAAGVASGGDLAAKIIAACREFRRWSLNHEGEFGMLFGTPLPGVNIEQDDTITECGGKFGNTFFVLILELWHSRPFPVPADDEIDPALGAQLDRYREILGEVAADLPRGLLLTFLRCWVRLYGIVALEVFGHLGFALDDAEPMFEMMLADTAPILGLDFPPAGEPARS